jgi:hypothetical protein
MTQQNIVEAARSFRTNSIQPHAKAAGDTRITVINTLPGD